MEVVEAGSAFLVVVVIAGALLGPHIAPAALPISASDMHNGEPAQPIDPSPVEETSVLDPQIKDCQDLYRGDHCENRNHHKGHGDGEESEPDDD